MKLIALLLLSLAISGTKQACTAGCLKCDASSNCVVADLSQGYVLSNNSAVKSTTTNCLLLNPDGTCAVCNAANYLDATSKCVAVPTASLITSCQYYATATSCAACNQGFYLNNNVCAQVTATIANCATYASATTCAACSANYILSLDLATCVSIASNANCSGYTYVTCNSCASGFHLNRNTYLSSNLAVDTAVNRTNLADFSRDVISSSDFVGLNVCQTNEGSNCATFAVDSNACTLCNANYYLDTAGNCNAYPTEPIPNCAVFVNATTCYSCQASFTLTNSSTCTAIPAGSVIQNCATYDTRSASVTCVACSATTYLSNNTCVARVNSLNLANCTTLLPTADKCDVCTTNYILSSESERCFAPIPNCSVHNRPDKNGTLQCTTCSSTYYLVAAVGTASNSCTQGSISNCATYSAANVQNCETCVNGYYLLNNVCVKQTDITNCTVYGQTSGVCTTCNPLNSVVAAYGSTCQTITPIANCAVHAGTVAAPTCTRCNSGFYLASSTSCLTLGKSNCVSGTANSCTSCVAATVLNLTGTDCVAPYTYINDQCNENNASAGNTITLNTAACFQCKANAIPINYANYYTCVSRAEITLANQGTNISDALASDCIKFNSTFQCTQCNPAVTNKYLTIGTNGAANTCVSTCTNGFARYVLTGTGYQINNYNVCLATSTVPNCAVYAPDLSNAGGNTGTNICIRCATNFVNVIDLTANTYSNANPNDTTPGANDTTYTTYILGPYAKFPAVTCVAFASVTQTAGVAPANAASNPITDCDYYSLISGSNYTCARCKIGTAGVPETNGYVRTCSTVVGCDATSVKYQLNTIFNNIISCHTCSGTNIPILAYNPTSDTVNTFSAFVRYSYSAAGIAADATNTTNQTIACRDPTAAPTGTTTWSINANCGIGAVNVRAAGSNANTNVGNYCLACKPGYYYAAQAVNPTAFYLAKTCDAIAQCRSSTIFDGCTQCNDTYILGFANSAVNFTSCVTKGNNTARLANCYAATITNSVADTCAVCNTGYSLNADNYCEALQPYNCAVGGFRLSFAGAQANLDWSLFLAGNAVGCNKCNSNNYALLNVATKSVCVTSTHVTNTVDTLTNSAYIEHCRNYTGDATSGFTCVTCQTNYIPSRNRQNCYLSNATTLTNCGITSNDQTPVCVECISKSFSINASGTCSSGNIASCSIYNYSTIDANFTSQHDKQYCMICNVGFYTNDDDTACLPAGVTNCDVSDTFSRCQICATGYTKIDNSGVNNGTVADACVPNPTVGNCASVTLANNTLTCTACANTATQVLIAQAANPAPSTCLAFSTVANCSAYSVSQLNNSSLACTACAQNFYLSANKCVQRTAILRCTTSTPNADTCTTCDLNSYLAADAKSCILNPAGIFRCATYSNATTCTACRGNYYLSNNTCNLVPTVITNCATYSSATTCSSCAATFALSNNTCVSATAQNCATYNSPSACATCPANYVLSTSNGVTSCTALAKTGCATIDANPPNNCLTCSTGYYLSNGACVAATTIARCTAYASATTCARCDLGYALAVDKLSCVTNARVLAYDDGNCNDSQVAASPVCSRCGAGRYFVNGACTGTCSVTGCLACSPTNNATCYICNTGYYQDSTGKCIAVNTTVVESVNIFGVLSTLMIVIAVMFK